MQGACAPPFSDTRRRAGGAGPALLSGFGSVKAWEGGRCARGPLSRKEWRVSTARPSLHLFRPPPIRLAFCRWPACGSPPSHTPAHTMRSFVGKVTVQAARGDERGRGRESRKVSAPAAAAAAHPPLSLNLPVSLFFSPSGRLRPDGQVRPRRRHPADDGAQVQPARAADQEVHGERERGGERARGEEPRLLDPHPRSPLSLSPSPSPPLPLSPSPLSPPVRPTTSRTRARWATPSASTPAAPCPSARRGQWGASSPVSGAWRGAGWGRGAAAAASPRRPRPPPRRRRWGGALPRPR